MVERTNESIVDRVMARLKQQPIGDLITEADLHDIVKEAIPKAFFEVRKVVDINSYNSRTVEKEPLLVEITRELMRDAVKGAVASWIAENADKLREMWQPVFNQGIEKYVAEQQALATTQHLRNVLGPVFDQLNQERAKMGLPSIFF